MCVSAPTPPSRGSALQLVSRAAAHSEGKGAIVRQKSEDAVQELIADGDDDEGDEDHEEGGDGEEAMSPAQIRAKALFLLVVGVGLVTFFR